MTANPEPPVEGTPAWMAREFADARATLAELPAWVRSPPPVEGALEEARPMRDSILLLASVAEHCLDAHDYDREGYEAVRPAIAAARSVHDGLRDTEHEHTVAAQLREAMFLTHYPHLQETGEGRIEGKCLEEPCVSMWQAARALSPGEALDE